MMMRVMVKRRPGGRSNMDGEGKDDSVRLVDRYISLHLEESWPSTY